MRPDFFATKNEHKFREVKSILGYDIQQIPLDLFEPQGVDVEIVVAEKSKDAFQKTGKLVLVEDTGLEFLAWNKLPGALIKWFLDAVGNEGLIKMLAGENDRRAVAKTSVGFFDGSRVYVYSGAISGHIADVVRGTNGFGWDQIFVPEGYSKSFAEITPEEKNTISMRRIALESMRKSLG